MISMKSRFTPSGDPLHEAFDELNSGLARLEQLAVKSSSGTSVWLCLSRSRYPKDSLKADHQDGISLTKGDDGRWGLFIVENSRVIDDPDDLAAPDTSRTYPLLEAPIGLRIKAAEMSSAFMEALSKARSAQLEQARQAVLSLSQTLDELESSGL